MQNKTKLTPEMKMEFAARDSISQVIKDKCPLAEKYTRKYGSLNGEASEKELDDIMKAFGYPCP